VRYDPEKPPDPNSWLELDEAEQLDAVLRYHKKIRFKAGSVKMHAVVHTAIETQLAEGHQAACDALERLLSDRLDRHEALHAVGAIFAEQLHAVLKNRRDFDNEEYERGLSELTVASWRERSDQE
jgi:hypothetical protein